MPAYIKVYVEDYPNNYYVATLDEAKETLSHMAEQKDYCPEDEEKYVFEAVVMTQEEFDNLPDFPGF